MSAKRLPLTTLPLTTLPLPLPLILLQMMSAKRLRFEALLETVGG